MDNRNIVSKLKGRIIHSQGREIVSNVYKFMKDEADSKCVSIPLSKARQRTAAATGVSERVISSINSELQKLNVSDNNETKCFSSPNKRHTSTKPVTGLDDFDKCVVRETVYNFHLKNNRLPTTELLMGELRDKINFQGGKSSLRSILKEIGFKWRRTQNNRKILIETPEVREKRISYLRTVKHYREQGRPIIYIDESYIHSSHMKNQSWSDDSNKGARLPISKGDRLIIVHAGGEKGFVPNALTTWKASNHSGDYHDNVNKDIFLKWVSEKLLPNLEPKSVLVIDNAPYHNFQIDKPPNSKSKKQDLKDWLTINRIPFSEDMYVPELYQLVKLHKPRLLKYKLDEIVKQHGHDVLRLPPYHPDLNPIELIWADVKGYVASRNTTCSFANVKYLTEEKISLMGAENWARKCEHVISIEKNYISKEPGIDNLVESCIVSFESDSESEDSYNEIDGIEEIL